MPTITLKGIPARLHRDLKARAKAHQRSLNKEVIATLQDAVVAPDSPADIETLLQEARQTRALFTRKVTLREIDSWKNSGRP